jgi:hypothetical protein
LALDQKTDVTQASARIGMFGTERLFPDRQRTLLK